ncbi:MAG: hypothetical protein JRG90_17045 [Deltaproteobacteria bacterium]|nr:hypothetical protein [Deltaproteobacteria bacterium]
MRIFLAIGSVAAADASARIFNLTHIGGALEVGVEISHQETESENSEPRTFDRFRFTEAIELDVAGYIVSSQLLTFQLGGLFGPRQEILSGDSGSGDTNSMLFGYNGTLNLFPSKPISLLLFASRFEDQLIQSFGANTDSLGDTLGERPAAAHAIRKQGWLLLREPARRDPAIRRVQRQPQFRGLDGTRDGASRGRRRRERPAGR